MPILDADLQAEAARERAEWDDPANKTVREYIWRYESLERKVQERHTDRFYQHREFDREVEAVAEEQRREEMRLRDQFAADRAARDQRMLEVRGWSQRHPWVWLGSTGRTAVLQPVFHQWLKRAKKAMPAKAVKSLRWMEQVSRRKTDAVPFLDWVTLDFFGDMITLTHWTGSTIGDEGQAELARATFAEPFFAEPFRDGSVRHPFTVTVDFPYLLDLVAVLSPERITFEKPIGAAPLVVRCGSSVSRFVHKPIPEHLTAYWLTPESTE